MLQCSMPANSMECGATVTRGAFTAEVLINEAASPRDPKAQAGHAVEGGGSQLPALRRAAFGALVLGAMGLILLVLDIAGDDDAEWVDFLTAADIVGMTVAALVVLGLLRAEVAREHRTAGALAALNLAKQAAENASLAKSRYLATVSHEIRSPLNAIYGYAQLAERDDGISAQEAARVIRRSAEHLTGLVEGLLDISQLEFGMLRTRSEVVRFGPFIEQIVWMMRPAAAAKGLKFEFVAPARMPDYVRLDPSRFRQVLINLLSNAIKFTDKGSVSLHIGYSGQIATFEVRDSGPGIAPRDHERIFEPFARGTGTVGSDGGAPTGGDGIHRRPGTGLGLAITRALVPILGGKLELESELGQGACFRITMMLNEVAGMLPVETALQIPSGYEGRRRHILLVEDNDDQRAFLQRLLDELGFEVSAKASGEAALAPDPLPALDLAILDISLPGMSGWEVALALKSQLGEDVRVLMLSANSEELHRPDCAVPAHDLFLVKPIELDRLVDAVGRLLGLNWRWALAEPSTPAPSPATNAVQEQLRKLQSLLSIGHVRGIEAEIGKLAEAAPEASALVERLYDHLDRYDLAGMARLIKES